MIPRRALLKAVVPALALAAMAPFAPAAQAQADWRKSIKEIRFGISQSENAEHAMARMEPFRLYLEQKFGVPVKVFRSPDYAGLIEAMRSGNLEIARIGPANYALAHKLMGDGVIPVLRDVDNLGAEGYYSILAVKADSPFQKLDDLRGKTIAWADPNSTSGFQYPTYFLRKAGYDPGSFFGRNAFAGGHENVVISLLAGQFDVGATHWTSEAQGNIQRMEGKGMIPKGQTRIIWKSPLIPNSPWVIRSSLPMELRQLYIDAITKMPVDGPEAWKVLTDGKTRGVVPARHEDYADVIAVTEENERARKRTP
jgi:phosphonate transport system substrate-binding protein